MSDKWGVLAEDGTVYRVGRWRNGRQEHRGRLWLALREAHLLRKDGEKGARVVRLGPPRWVFWASWMLRVSPDEAARIWAASR